MVVLLLWNNVLITLVPDRGLNHALVNGTAAGLLLAAARRAGLSWAALGLSHRRLPAGLRWGGTAFALVTAGYAIVLAVPGLRGLLADDRVAGLGPGDIAVQVLVGIPLGTVLWEEVAFRGVLLAALRQVMSTGAAVTVAAVVFGLWHIRPTVGGLTANGLAEEAPIRVLAVLVVVGATTVAGLIFGWLRLRSGSLLAPALLHLATNALGTLAAVAAVRLG